MLLPETPRCLNISSVPLHTTMSLLLTLRTSDVSPTLAMSQILPRTNQSTSVGGASAHWHSSWETKHCTPCGHYFTFPISSSCFLVGVSCRLFVQGTRRSFAKYCHPGFVVTTPDSLRSNCPEILPFCIRALTDWEIRFQHWMSWILETTLPPATCKGWYLAANDRLQ